MRFYQQEGLSMRETNLHESGASATTVSRQIITWSTNSFLTTRSAQSVTHSVAALVTESNSSNLGPPCAGLIIGHAFRKVHNPRP
jgi:hypothetical protein